MQIYWLSVCTESDIPLSATCALVAAGLVYLRGCYALRRTRSERFPGWRLLSIFAGIPALFVAVSSALDIYSETLLFKHVAKHFVLMSAAPPLIVLGCPVAPILGGLPRIVVRRIVSPLLRSSFVHRVLRLFSRLPFAWLAMNLTYFLTSDLVNMGLSALLFFFGRLLYPSYALVDRPFGLDALKDQIAAGASMWVFGSAVFLIPAIYLTARFLANGRLLDEKTGLERVRAMAQ